MATAHAQYAPNLMDDSMNYGQSTKVEHQDGSFVDSDRSVEVSEDQWRVIKFVSVVSCFGSNPDSDGEYR